MAAVVGMVHVTPEIDVFTLPHSKMRQLIVDTTEEVTSTNFEDISSMKLLLQQLSTTLIQFRLHEEIEDKYIMRVLKQRLDGEMLKKLMRHLHANSYISDLIMLVKNLQKEIVSITCEDTLKGYGERLNRALKMFYEEYLPHMIDEEKVFQPLLLNYFSYNELRNIKERVLKLHCIKDEEIPISTNIVLETAKPPISKITAKDNVLHEDREDLQINLPQEILLKVFRYLQPRELCRCAQVSRQWSTVAMDSQNWSVLHPSRWGRGDFTFGQQTSSDDCNCDCEPNYDMLEFRDNVDESSTTGSEDESEDDEGHFKEAKILLGVSRYLLPKVGKGVKTLVLECSKAISNGMLYRVLSQCPNLEYLDVSQTIISDLGLNGLFKEDGGRYLKYLDVSGCVGITDKTLIKLSSFYGKALKTEKRGMKCMDCNCIKQKDETQACGSKGGRRSVRGLECLRLSGCYRITDVGLKALAKCGLPNLRHLDLSGCLNVSATGLRDLVSTCCELNAEDLYYCDNIVEGPYSQSASGCQNVECANRVCCRNINMRQQDMV